MKRHGQQRLELGIAAAHSLGVESFDWKLRMCPNFDLAFEAILYHIYTNPIMEFKNESPPEGELTIVSQYGKSS